MYINRESYLNLTKFVQISKVQERSFSAMCKCRAGDETLERNVKGPELDAWSSGLGAF